jgi:predicted transcriptional regulator
MMRSEYASDLAQHDDREIEESPSRLTLSDFDALVRGRRKRPLRTQNAIVTAILEACRTPTPQHWIMVKARIGFGTFQSHMQKLIEKGIVETSFEEGRLLYRVNSKGFRFLNSLS